MNILWTLPEIKAAFFTDFELLAGNPYLMNHNSCWQNFLGLPEYGELWKSHDFRREFVEKICAVPGWQARTLEYFEKWLKPFEEKGHRETKCAAWRRAKRKSRFLHVKPESRVTQQEKEEHSKIMAQLYDRGIYDSLAMAVPMEEYLKIFLPYARDRKGQFVQMQTEGRRLRRRAGFGRIGFAAAAVCLGCGMAFFWFQVAVSSVPGPMEGQEESGKEQNRQEQELPQEMTPRQLREMEELAEQRLDELQAVYETLTGERKKTPHTRTTYNEKGEKCAYQEYDKAGNLLYEEAYSGNKLQSAHRYAYDEEGRLLSDIYYDFSEGMQEETVEEQYEYDALGRVAVHWFREERFAEDWQYRYVYNEEGQVSAEEHWLYDDVTGDYRLSSVTEYSYDGQGNATEEWAYANDADRTVLWHAAHTYDEENICRNSLCFYTESLDCITEREFRYNGKGELVFLRETEEILGDSRELITRYLYDGMGNMLEETKTCEGEVIYQILCTYDGEGRLLREEKQYGSGVTVWSYKYDSVGNMVRREVQYEDGTKNAAVWEYDAVGSCLSESYYVDGELSWSHSYEYEY